MAGQGGERKPRRRREPAPDLGSLSKPVKAPGAAPRQCTSCGSGALTQLAMDLSDGTPVIFVSCQTCEHRTWFDAEGAELTMEAVLGRSRRKD